jgi:hypothetical protein
VASLEIGELTRAEADPRLRLSNVQVHSAPLVWSPRPRHGPGVAQLIVGVPIDRRCAGRDRAPIRRMLPAVANRCIATDAVSSVRRKGGVAANRPEYRFSAPAVSGRSMQEMSR